MASLVYNSTVDDLAKGKFAFGLDTIKVMLVGAGYTPNKDTHTKRSDVTGEVSGAGYTAGGATVTTSVALNTTLDRTDVALGGTVWPSSTITAKGGVYYKSRGGAANLDELICYIDFGGDVISMQGAFTLAASQIQINNPS